MNISVSIEWYTAATPPRDQYRSRLTIFSLLVLLPCRPTDPQAQSASQSPLCLPVLITKHAVFHILEPVTTCTSTFDQAVGEVVVGVSKGSNMSLEMVRQGFCFMNVNNTDEKFRSRLVFFVNCGTNVWSVWWWYRVLTCVTKCDEKDVWQWWTT